MNVAIVAMVNTTTTTSDGSVTLEECPPADSRSFDPDGVRSTEVTGVKVTFPLPTSLVITQHLINNSFQRNFEQDYGQFEWTVKEQGLVLSGFSMGYVLTQILGGYLDQWFGGKWVRVPFSCI